MEKIRSKIYNLLRWSEKYTKTDMLYLTKGGLWLGVGQIVATSSGFLLAVVFANFLPKETYGTYKYILSIISILSISTLPGLNTAVNQAVARGYEGSVIKLLKLKIHWGLIGSLASIGIAIYYYFNDDILLSISFLIVSLFVPLMDSLSLYNSFLQGKKLFKQAITYYTIGQIASVSILIATIFLSGKLFAILLAYFLPFVIARLFFLKLTLKKFPPNEKEDPETASYGKHLSFLGVIGNFALYLDKLLIFYYLGAVEVAIYSIAISPVEQVKSLYKNIYPLALPKFAKRSFEDINRAIYKRLWQLFLLGGLISITYIIAAPYIFKLLFPKYMEAVFFSRLIAVVLTLRLPMTLFSSVIQSKLTDIPKKWLYWGVIPQIIMIISLFVFTPLYGIAGVIYSKIIFLIVSFIVNLTQWKLLVKRQASLSEQV